MQIIPIALSIGFLRALYGSGYLKRYSSLLNKILEWIVIPLAIVIPAVGYSNSLYGILLGLPYLWKQATGTGGDMQAQWNNPINNPHEWQPFDWISTKLATWYCNIPGEPKNINWFRVWGFWYCALTSLVFMLPFLATQHPLYALPLTLYPLAVRYLSWRIAGEFGLYTVYTGLWLYAAI